MTYLDKTSAYKTLKVSRGIRGLCVSIPTPGNRLKPLALGKYKLKQVEFLLIV